MLHCRRRSLILLLTIALCLGALLNALGGQLASSSSLPSIVSGPVEESSLSSSEDQVPAAVSRRAASPQLLHAAAPAPERVRDSVVQEPQLVAQAAPVAVSGAPVDANAAAAVGAKLLPEPEGLFGVSWGSVRGLRDWLVAREENFGGFIERIACLDRKHNKVVGKTKCAGGDRMGRGYKHHAYGGCYAAVIDAFSGLWQEAFAQSRRENKKLMAGELGILSGSGVAMWSEIFANADLHGYDRFLNNTQNNMPFLRSKGAFQHSELQLHFWDQMSHRHEVGLQKPPATAGFIFFVDDAMHMPEPTRDTLNIFSRFMHKDGAYIIEDMNTEKAKGAKQWIPAAYDAWSCTESTERNAFWLIVPNSTVRPDLQAVVQRTQFVPLFDDATLAAMGIDTAARARQVAPTVATAPTPSMGGPTAASSLALGGAKLLPKPEGLFGVSWEKVEDLRNWLVAREDNFGGFIERVACLDRKADRHGGKTKCAGGDRMGRGNKHHAYGGCYAAVIDAFSERWEEAFAESRREQKKLMAGELGILSGSGVAMWSEVFANAELHGFDRFINNTAANMPFLRSKGAFQHSDLNLHYWQQMAHKHEVVLDKPPVSAGFIFFIDDAMHMPNPTRDTLNFFKHYMHKDGAYIIEDMNTEKAEGAKHWMPQGYEAWSCTESTERNAFWLLVPNSTARPDLQPVVQRTGFLPLFDDATLAAVDVTTALEAIPAALPIADAPAKETSAEAAAPEGSVSGDVVAAGGAELLREPEGLFGVSWESVESLRAWLVAREENFGGFIQQIACLDRKINKHAGKTRCAGGDRMGAGHRRHAYGACYAAVIDAFAGLWKEAFAESRRAQKKLLAGELGILSGSGVAMWSEIFANADLHGYDRVLNNTRNNLPFLRSKGAFQHSELNLHFWDQMARVHEVGLPKPPATPGFIFFVDDAMHMPEPTRDTLSIFKGYMHKDGAYIIEDMNTEKARGAKAWIPAAYEAWSCTESTERNAFWLLVPNSTARPDLQAVVQRTGFVPLFDNATLA